MKKLVYLLFTAFIITSCNNDDDHTSSSVPPSASSFANLINAQRQARTQTQIFNLDQEDIAFTSEQEAFLNIPRTSLALNGAPVTGNVKLEFIELYHAADLLLTNVSTMGINGNNLNLLKTGGAFYINVTKNGVPVDVVDEYYLYAKASLTGGDVNGYTSWTGDQTSSIMEWTNTGVDVVEGESGYLYAILNDLNWINIDKFRFQDNASTAAISMNIASQYNHLNCNIYFLIPDVTDSIGQFNLTNGNNLTLQNIPTGITMRIIILTESNGNFKMAHKDFTTSSTMTVSIPESDFNLYAPSQVYDAIMNLYF